MRKASKAARASADPAALEQRRLLVDARDDLFAAAAQQPPRREHAFGGSAAISRAAFSASASTGSGATTVLTKPGGPGVVGVSGRPITSSEKARAWPISRGAISVEAASGSTPRPTKGVEKRASLAADHVVAMQQHRRADADGVALHRRDQRLVAARQRMQKAHDRRAERAVARGS